MELLAKGYSTTVLLSILMGVEEEQASVQESHN